MTGGPAAAQPAPVVPSARCGLDTRGVSYLCGATTRPLLALIAQRSSYVASDGPSLLLVPSDSGIHALEGGLRDLRAVLRLAVDPLLGRELLVSATSGGIGLLFLWLWRS